MLISAQELAAALGSAAAGPATAAARWVVVDCRFNLTQPDAGRVAYVEGHIPGAWYADLDRDLSAPRGSATGRHPLPEARQLCAFLGRMGITPETRVVAYDDASGAIAARLWWLLRWLGHTRVVLLDGGFAAWQRAGLPVSQTVPRPHDLHFAGTPGHMPVIDTARVVTALRDGSIRLLDMRAEERFLGQVEPIDTVAGHVPGAVNVPFAGNLAAGQVFQSADQLAGRYEPLVAGEGPENIVCMCGSGVTACHGILALELAGVPGATLYPGSWSEWIRSPERPVATG